MRNRDRREMVFEPELKMDGGEEVSTSQLEMEHQWLQLEEADRFEFRDERYVIDKVSSSGTIKLLLVDLDGKRLENGTYVLDVTFRFGKEESHSHTRFATHWRNMPISLNDPNVAIDNLGFILSRSEVRALRRGSRSEKIERFQAFWREKDPTPDTEFNELQAEYYRRVDHAAFAFRTGGAPVPNGLKTDRSKVYVVEGPPDDVERDFPGGGGVRETWTYRDGRTFVFEAGSSISEYRLVRGS